MPEMAEFWLPGATAGMIATCVIRVIRDAGIGSPVAGPVFELDFEPSANAVWLLYYISAGTLSSSFGAASYPYSHFVF
jgi:hypothetical protein